MQWKQIIPFQKNRDFHNWKIFFKHVSKSLKFSKSEKVKSLTTITNKIYPQKSTRKKRAFEKYHLLKSPT